MIVSSSFISTPKSSSSMPMNGSSSSSTILCCALNSRARCIPLAFTQPVLSIRGRGLFKGANYSRKYGNFLLEYVTKGKINAMRGGSAIFYVVRPWIWLTGSTSNTIILQNHLLCSTFVCIMKMTLSGVSGRILGTVSIEGLK